MVSYNAAERLHNWNAVNIWNEMKEMKWKVQWFEVHSKTNFDPA